MHASSSNMGFDLPQILPARLARYATLGDTLGKRAVSFGQHNAVAGRGSSSINKVGVRIEIVRQTSRIVSPDIAKRIHQNISQACAHAPRKSGSLSVRERRDERRELEPEAVL